ncbi:hypothetical protein [Hymenobacter sp. BT190]|uniref:hypothetical protein n=1 Tax=Hymenobacter sp. BT190 TaxID=2763505 RepID=UPI0016516B1A|nr:hypothetical protein [Hymenobacter sp. BT190]MBC6697414.1 hypothetical protein [Hymenobacter sp. BT190]
MKEEKGAGKNAKKSGSQRPIYTIALVMDYMEEKIGNEQVVGLQAMPVAKECFILLQRAENDSWK